MVQVTLKILIGIALLGLPFLTGLVGFVLTAVYDPGQRRFSSWLIRSGLAATAAPALRFGEASIRPEPVLVTVFRAMNGGSTAPIEILVGGGAVLLIFSGVMGYGLAGPLGSGIDQPTTRKDRGRKT